MKTLKLSKLSIFMISIIIFAFTVYGIITYTLPATTQNEKIYLYNTFPLQDEQPSLIKISDMQPNSFGFFMYPSSYKFSSENAYQTFLLIRLPAWLGGGENNSSAFRAYSAVDLSSHCFAKYWPQNERQRIEAPCSGNMYRPLDGYLFQVGGNPVLLHENIALPQLDLAADSQGYLYVKPPKFTEDKNGVIGIGRNLSSEEINQSSSFITQQQNILEKYHFRAPPKLTNGFEALAVDGDWYQQTVTYAKPGFRNDTMTLFLEYCSCITPNELLAEQSTTYSQMWKVGDDLILATPNSVGPHQYSDFRFVFYKNNYKIIFLTGKQFDEGMKLTLDNFFNGTSISELQKVSIIK